MGQAGWLVRNAEAGQSLAAAALAVCVLTGVALLVRPLTPIDETRYVGVAWEMWLRKDPLVLYLNGEPYSHKPPLLFWLYNLGWAVFGVNEWWPRLLSPLFALGSLALTASIARRLWPDDPGAKKNALLILASTFLWMVFATAAMFDALLAFFVLLGLRGVLVAAEESMLRGFAALAPAIGLGVLAKGPVVLLHVLPAALLVFWWGRPRRGARRWYGGLLLAVLGGAAIALAWAIPAAIHGGEEYRRAIFWGQTAHRVVDSFAHKRPLWWYLPLLPVLLFPWLWWPHLLRRLVPRGPQRQDAGLRFCLAWALPVFTAFSLISGKQVHYLVPILPAFALYAGRVVSTSGPQGGAWLPVAMAGVAGVAMLYFAFHGIPAFWVEGNALPLWPGGVLVLLAAGLLGPLHGIGTPLAKTALAGLATLALGQVWLFQAVGPRYDVHPIAAAVRRAQDAGAPVCHLGSYHGQFHFAGRLTKPLEIVETGRLAAWLDRHPDGVVVGYLKAPEKRPAALFAQPYLEKTVVLLDAQQARVLLAAGLSGP